MKDIMPLRNTVLIVFSILDVLYRIAGDENLIVTYWNHDTTRMKALAPNVPLIDLCNDETGFDIINLGFVYLRPDGVTVEVKLGSTCFYYLDGGRKLHLCEDIANAVRVCQQKDKLVLISVGDFYNKPLHRHSGLVNLDEVLWNSFFGGTDKSYTRPFGDVVLDGLNIITEDVYSDKYASLIMRVKEKMRDDTTKDYLMTVSPYCTFRDATQPGFRNSILRTSLQYIDQLYLRFYNQECGIKDYSNFGKTLNEWFQYVRGLEGSVGRVPRIFIGVPASPKATRSAQYFRYVNELDELYKDLRANNLFGGFMLWDAKWDVYNTVGRQKFSHRLLAKLSETEVNLEEEEEEVVAERPPLSNSTAVLPGQEEQKLPTEAMATKPLVIKPTPPNVVPSQVDPPQVPVPQESLEQGEAAGLPLTNPQPVTDLNPNVPPIQQTQLPSRVPPAPVNPEDQGEEEILEDEEVINRIKPPAYPGTSSIPYKERLESEAPTVHYDSTNALQPHIQDQGKADELHAIAVEQEKVVEREKEKLRLEKEEEEKQRQKDAFQNQVNEQLKPGLPQGQMGEQQVAQEQLQQQLMVQNQLQNQIQNQPAIPNQPLPGAWPCCPNQFCFYSKLRKKCKRNKLRHKVAP